MGNVPLVVQVMAWLFGGMLGGLAVGAALFWLGTILIWAPPMWLGRFYQWVSRRPPYKARHSPGGGRRTVWQAIADADRTELLPAISGP